MLADDIVTMIKTLGFQNKVGDRIASIDTPDRPENRAVNKTFIKTPKPGNANVTTWRKKYCVEDWPRVAWELTRLTADEKARINSMGTTELLEFVRTEWHERVNILFPPGCDGMLIKEMRARVIDKLRLSYQELKALTNANKHFVVGYVQAVRPALMKADTSVARVPKIRKWPNDLLTLQSDQLEPFVQQTLKIQYQGVALVFKIFDITCDETRRDFMWQTQNHIEMYKRMPSTVPRLMKAYFLKSGTTLRGVQIMERCPGVPLAQILERAKKTPSMMTRLAELLGDKLRLMQRHKTWHGDLHADNIIVELDADDRIVNMFLIDFGHTILDLPIDDHNLYGFLDDYKMHYWIPYLRNTGIHVAKDIDNWDDYDFEARSYVGLHGTLVRNMKKDPLITLATVTE